MWTAVALTTVMTLAPAQGIELKNARSTYGIMGETRKDDKLLPGDIFVVHFDIEGLKVKDNGTVLYSMGMELTKKGKKKPEFKRDSQDLEGELSLGGTTLPSYAMTTIGTDSDPGEYTFKITIKDRLGKTEKVLEKTFEVLQPKLGFIQVHLSAPSRDAVPPIAVVGQRIYVHSPLVGFKLGKDKLPHVSFEMTILDDAGKPTVAKAFKGDIKTDLKATPTPGVMDFIPRALELNKLGKYKIVIKAKCNISNESVEQTLNLTVLGKAD